jgi:hypothetical protein
MQKIWWQRHIPPSPQGSSEWAGPKNDTSSSWAPHVDAMSLLTAPPTCCHVSITGPTYQLPRHLCQPHTKVTHHRLGPHLSDAMSSLWVPPVRCHISIVGPTCQLPCQYRWTHLLATTSASLDPPASCHVSIAGPTCQNPRDAINFPWWHIPSMNMLNSDRFAYFRWRRRSVTDNPS